MSTVFDCTGQVHLLEQRLVVRRHSVGSDEPGQRETFPAFDQRSGDTERGTHVLRGRVAGILNHSFYSSSFFFSLSRTRICIKRDVGKSRL